jgi:hypothetical protein
LGIEQDWIHRISADGWGIQRWPREFYDGELFNDKQILVRNVWSDITPNSCRFEQSFSNDGGKTWEPNWITTFTRISN